MVIDKYEYKVESMPFMYGVKDVYPPPGDGWYIVSTSTSLTLVADGWVPRPKIVMVIIWSRPIYKEENVDRPLSSREKLHHQHKGDDDVQKK